MKVWRLKQPQASVFADQTDYETHNGHDGEYEEKDFGDFYRTGCDATKAEYRCNQCNDQKYHRVMQHLKSLPEMMKRKGLLRLVQTIRKQNPEDHVARLMRYLVIRHRH